MVRSDRRPAAVCAALALALLSAFATPSAIAQAPAPQPAPPAAAEVPASDYARPENWLCLPGRDDACAANLDATVIQPDGQRQQVAGPVADVNAPVDCFYVYPTVSLDAGGNSDMVAGPEEQRVARLQAAPFRGVCRVFAPMYRQVTIAALRARLAGQPMPSDGMLAYRDVVAAWNHYLAHHNRGRGVVLIGHSQGALMLHSVITREIEGRPVQAQLVSALTIGANTLVPKGRDVGGTFRSIPLCRAATQTGCAVAYVSFRASSPPPADTLFGRPVGERVVACTNPAALAGGSAVARAHWSTGAEIASGGAARPEPANRWQALQRSMTTPLMQLPGLTSTRCVEDEHGSYLAVSVQPDARVDDIGGDVVANGTIVRNWGLHLVDMGVVMGDLVELVRQQSQAWLAARR